MCEKEHCNCIEYIFVFHCLYIRWHIITHKNVQLWMCILRWQECVPSRALTSRNVPRTSHSQPWPGILKPINLLSKIRTSQNHRSSHKKAWGDLCYITKAKVFNNWCFVWPGMSTGQLWLTIAQDESNNVGVVSMVGEPILYHFVFCIQHVVSRVVETWNKKSHQGGAMGGKESHQQLGLQIIIISKKISKHPAY